MRCEAVDEVTARPRTAGLACSACGCTDDNACPGGCYWVSLDPPLCSACAEVAADIAEMHRQQHSAPAGGLFMRERCPAAETPSFHVPIWLDEMSGYCARCKGGFCT